MRAGFDSSFTSSIGTQPGQETAAGTAPPPHYETHRRARSNTFYNKVVNAEESTGRCQLFSCMHFVFSPLTDTGDVKGPT